MVFGRTIKHTGHKLVMNTDRIIQRALKINVQCKLSAKDISNIKTEITSLGLLKLYEYLSLEISVSRGSLFLSSLVLAQKPEFSEQSLSSD